VDGATTWQSVRYVVIPLLVPALTAAAVVRVVMGVKVFDEMYLLTHGGPGTSTTIISLLIRGIVFDDIDLGYGSAVSLLTIAFIALVAVFVVVTRSTVRRLS
jgi:multiple sugar transport system permease protein